MANNILSLDYKEALEYFMSASNYSTLETPEYIDMTSLLISVRKNIEFKPFTECIKRNPSFSKDLNFTMNINKDGKYAVRPISFVNPFSYYFLAREICKEDNWKFLKTWFKEMHQPSIMVCSLPVIAEKEEAFHKATAILNWWNNFEQGSLNLSLEFPYMFVSDIRNCYGTIKTDIITKALTCLDDKNNLNLFVKELSELINIFQGDLTIGLPQGNALSDFLAEIVLSYADKLLYQAINAKKLNCKYKILRYRDDYRIFCDNFEELKQISVILQTVLLHLNFELNSQKTKFSDDLITSSIKNDKLAYIYNTPIFNKKGCDFDGIQKHLLFIRQFGKEFPNSGQLKTLLSDLSERIDEKINGEKHDETEQLETVFWEDEDDFDSIKKDLEQIDTHKENIFKTLKVYPNSKMSRIKEEVRPIISIATQIAIENVTCSHYALKIISQLLNSCSNAQKKEISKLVVKRILELPNNDYLQIWLQAMTYTIDKKEDENHYTNSICKIVMGKKVDIWNIDWLKDDLQKGIKQNEICNKTNLPETESIIRFKERDSYLESSKTIYKL